MSRTLYMLYYSAMNQYLEVEFSVQHKPYGTIPHNNHIVSCCRGILAFRRCRILLFPGMETMCTVEHKHARFNECGKGVSFCLVKHLAKCCRILFTPQSATPCCCGRFGMCTRICGSTTSPSSLKIISLYMVAS